MNQGGLKHAPTESNTRLDKRERRRGAAGRAAVLRRAPSDSDCSGETASLSADSGDRVVRPIPPPTRSGKSRSRRRGSEWEVLEGLKDGQRFEKRPDVFNGYLHKKRKWPLKGWHKRFFVVDGGILVYARSPTDVARGRLHGSVDVGLSVISAKARRRRIDIDADEFIYHLRAKTPDVFRTWLNVLKTHRLYRQHLLTFGARESVPKIHAPLDDLPPTDTSSHTSHSSITISAIRSIEENPSSLTCNSIINTESSLYYHSPKPTNDTAIFFDTESSIYDNKEANYIKNWGTEDTESDIFPLNFEALEHMEVKFNNIYQIGSLCSMNCRKYTNFERKKSPDTSLRSTDVEKQIHSTELDMKSLKINDPYIESSLKSNDPCRKSTAMCEFNLNYDVCEEVEIKNIEKASMAVRSATVNENTRNLELINDKAKSLFTETKIKNPSACFFFTRKRSLCGGSMSAIRKSKKSTNVVKYRNVLDEPTLKRPLSKCMLLGKYKTKLSHADKGKHCSVGCDVISKENNEVQVESAKENKALQDAMTTSEYDKITERLMISIFESHKGTQKGDEVEFYINQVIKDLYDVKETKDIHPIKALFRSLLEFWLKNTSISQFKEAMYGVKSINRQSNVYFTKDKNLSNSFFNKVCKETQFHGISDIIIVQNKQRNTNKKKCKLPRNDKKPPPLCPTPRRDTESFEKERRIQELERLLKNTVYICETTKSKEKDIKITKTLINNLESKKSFNNKSNDDISNSSTELSKIQETINDLINDTEIPPDVAKEFLGAYLDVLLQDSSKSIVNTSSQSSKTCINPKCDVQTESVIRKVSKSVTTLDIGNVKFKNANKTPVDSGQMYLKDVLDKITSIFSKTKKHGDKKSDEIRLSNTKVGMKDELGRPVKEYLNKSLIQENGDDSSVVIDLSKYSLEHLSMFSDPAIRDMMSITIKLKEKPPDYGESKHQCLNLKFSDDSKSIGTKINKSEVNVLSYMNSNNTSNSIFNKLPKELKSKNPYLDYNTTDFIDLKPYFSNSDTTSKAFRIIRESEHSLDLSFKSSHLMPKDFIENDDAQSCYIMSLKKGALSNTFQSRKKVRLKELEGTALSPHIDLKFYKNSNRYPEELAVFEKPVPKSIDEKFILLLLENLMLLSKDIPSLHKDISNLYFKLKKKHERVVKTCANIQRLSLLGKIYNEDTCNKSADDIEIEMSKMSQINQTKDIITEAATTSTSIPKTDVKIERAISALFIKIESVNTETQTETNIIESYADNVQIQNQEAFALRYDENALNLDDTTPGITTDKSDIYIKNIIKSLMSKQKSNETKVTTAQTMSTDSINNNGVITIDQATSNPNWFRKICTKECAISTVIKCFLDNDYNSFRVSNPMKIERDVRKKTKQTSNKVKEDLIKEICLLSPSFKVSTQSQTERKLKTNKERERGFKLYQLFVSNKFDLTKTSSMRMTSNTENVKSDDLKTIYRCTSDPSFCSGLFSPTSPPIRGPQFVSGTPGGRLASWIIESGGPLENASRELGQAQLSVQQLQRLLDALEMQQQVHHDTDVSIEGASPNVKKDRRKFGLRKKKSNSKCASVELVPPHIDPSSSHMALSTLTAPPSPGGGSSSVPNSAASLPIACAAARPQSLPGTETLGTAAGPASLSSLTPDHQLREDFTVLAKDLLASLKTIVATLVCERGRLRAAMEAGDTASSPGGSVVASLRTNLTSALQQNSELRCRLSRIHMTSDLAEISPVANSDPVTRQFQQSLSYSSSCVSASEFFDAEAHEDDEPEEVIAADEAGVIELDGDSSSEAGSLSSEEGSASSDNSEGAMLSAEQVTLRLDANGTESRSSCWTRRTRLPAPRPTPGGPSLWNLLYKNIGKDLSQISMPVTINEPLNMLQRLCEELEYSELLDSAADCINPIERMSLIAAFAVSAYASSAHRAASKPFNPLLAETYECVRDDRGFRFIAEQVSHHPPISTCHAEAPRWVFWQEARIKTKFWGKSMEFQPAGRVHVRLLATGDHYTWNKVTTCVHNLFGGQRWVDQYGDMHITCNGNDIMCKLNFIKASSWSSSRHEVRGAVTCNSTGARLRLAGRWSEALYAGDPPAARCLWRPGAMPPEHEMYYGFTRFAMELNEMEPGMRDILPHTDTRLRPDQRALEEGDVNAAEQLKHELEQSQRERRRDSPDHRPLWFRKTVEDGDETWVFSGEYWKAREAGFSEDQVPRIW